MPGTRCVNCRWWNGDREYAPKAHNEKLRHGKCERIHPSSALRDDMQARLYPVGASAWLNSRFDFSCALWERELVAT